MSHFNLDQIKAFMAVVRLGGVSKAAESLYLTQPAITTPIKRLEEEIGAPLFLRDGKSMQLTRIGEKFREYAEKFEHLGSLVERDILADHEIERYLRIGVSETIAQCWLPNFISALKQRYPKVKLDINVDVSNNMRNDLISRKLDLALMLGPVSEFSVDNIELPPFEMAWYAGSDVAEEIGQDLSGQSIITFARTTRPYRELKTMLFERVGPDISFITSSSLTACFRLVEIGLGVAALPRTLGRVYEMEGKIRQIDIGWVPNPLVFTASYVGEPNDYSLKHFAELAKETAEIYHHKANLI